MGLLGTVLANPFRPQKKPVLYDEIEKKAQTNRRSKVLIFLLSI